MSDFSDDFNTCGIVTESVVRALRMEGVDAQWFQCHGLLEPAPDCDMRWDGVPPEHRNHYVVKVGELWYDWTPLQVWPDAPVPLVERDYDRRWAEVYNVTPEPDNYLEVVS